MEREEVAGGYMLCASPRSGSTLLCDMLSHTGVAGAPASYLRPASIAEYARQWHVPTSEGSWDRAYLDALRRHGGAGSGVPALRIMWSDMPAVLERLRAIAPKHRSDRERVRHLLGVEHFVHLRRDDLIAQAVSLVLAKQTGLWHRNADGSLRGGSDDTGGEAIYDERQIAAELRMLEVEAAGWDSWFSAESISPLRLTYEDLAADPAGALEEVLEAIGRPVRLPLPQPATARLASEINEDWTSRFRRRTGS